ncbi:MULTISPECIES: hypothetical protein [Vibrio]|uniref:hypothetical protein n=1 Tax=Vibrio TaxID=662 RepID=UPI001055CC91|nr:MULTISPECIES: hypothetical protein [unclassified Vibrio]TKE80498.1 hypothetical protein FCV56_15610 [Vibrio sp. F12]TKE81493.1 hypothetical protein FCV54_13265 [Vibrio sp. F12]TKE88285.1 hypothetical protein FCV53_23165 [Vibrio sp. F12]TKF03174.1 hypothetical protein FCV61_00080 [Vibrio sp. F12]
MKIKILTIILLSFPTIVSAHINHIDPDDICYLKVKEMMIYIYKLDPSNEKFQKVSEKMDSIDVLIGEKKYCDAENILARLLRK